MERRLQDTRAEWRHAIGDLNCYPLRDIKSPVTGENTDMMTALEGWFLMCEYRALEDFGRRWRDKEGRREVWREVVEFWGYGEVYRDGPVIDEPSGGGHNGWSYEV